MIKRMLAVLCSLCLAVSLLAAGFGVCTLPQTTELLSRITSDFETAPYTPGQLVRCAVATRDFTVNPYTSGEDFAKGRLGTTVMDAALASASDAAGGKQGEWADGRIEAAYAQVENQAANEARSTEDYLAMLALGAQDTRYALDADAVDHLVDCNVLITGVVPVLLAVAAVALACALVLAFCGRRQLGWALVGAPTLLLGCMVALGVWAAVDFYGFFAAFHGVFFPQGNWEFDADSLLICMLPEGFWMGMGVVWLAVTVCACIISLGLGRKLLHD